MMGLLVTITIIGTIIWFLRSHRNRAEITFRAGEITETKGDIASSTLSALREVGRMTQCTGDVVIRHNDSLFFSGEINDGDQQRIRNAFYSAR